MSVDVSQVKVLNGYRVELTFTDGTRGVLDLENDIVGKGGVWKPLESFDYFRKVRVNPELGTITWPNEVDYCPDVLYRRVTGKPIPFARPAESEKIAP